MGHGHSKSRLKTVLTKGRRADEKDIGRLWDAFDKDRDGHLDVQEIKKMQKMRVEFFKEVALEKVDGDTRAVKEIQEEEKKQLDETLTLWHELDLDKDGHVEKEEFMRLAHDLILFSPFKEILREYEKRRTGDMGESETSPMMKNIKKRSESPFRPALPTLIRNESENPDFKVFLPLGPVEVHEFGAGAVGVELLPMGWTGDILHLYEEEKDGYAKIKLQWAMCYAHIKNVKFQLERRLTKFVSPEKNTVDKNEQLITKGLSGCIFYHKVALGELGKGDIMALTEDEMTLLLPMLLSSERHSKAVLRRLEKSSWLMRRAKWLKLAQFDFPAGMFNHALTAGATNAYRFFCQTLNRELAENMEFDEDELGMYCPIWPERPISYLKVVKKFDSGNAPALLKCKLAGLGDIEAPLMYKPDDIRSDMCVLNCFGVFNKIWGLSKPLYMGFIPHAYTFDCCPMTEEVGVMEFIQQSTTLRDWDEKKLRSLSQEQKIRFICTAAGSYVASYILGCRDRHLENFMVKNDHTLLQIDFKRCFDRKARGVVDSPHFAVKTEVKMELEKMGISIIRRGRLFMKVNGWDVFMRLCWHALKGLRAKSMAVVKLITGMFSGLRKNPHFRKRLIERWVLHALLLNLSDSEAEKEVYRLVTDGLKSWSKYLKDYLHEMAKSRRGHQQSKERKEFGSLRTPRSENSHGNKKSQSGIKSPIRAIPRSFSPDFYNTKAPKYTRHCSVPTGNSAKLSFKSKFLNLSDMNWDDLNIREVQEHIAQRQAEPYLSSAERLVSLDLSGNHFKLSGTRLIMNQLRQSTYHLKELSFAGIEFGSEGAEEIGRFAHNNGVLETLDISGCGVCQNNEFKGLAVICSALKSVGCGIVTLNMGSNFIDHKGLEMIRKAIKDNFVVKFIDLTDNNFKPSNLSNHHIQRHLLSNRNETRVILTICGVNGFCPPTSNKRRSAHKYKARVIFPGISPIYTKLLSMEDNFIAWNQTVMFAVQDTTIRARPRIEIMDENNSLCAASIPPSDLRIPTRARSSSPMKSSAESSPPMPTGNSPAFFARQISKTKPRGPSVRQYNLTDVNGCSKGLLVISVHTGDPTGGGLISAELKYKRINAGSRRSTPRGTARNTELKIVDVTHQLRARVTNGVIIFREGDDFNDIFDDEDLDTSDREEHKCRQYHSLSLCYRVGCQIVRSTFSVPILSFSRVFVGFGVPTEMEFKAPRQIPKAQVRMISASSLMTAPSMIDVLQLDHAQSIPETNKSNSFNYYPDPVLRSSPKRSLTQIKRRNRFRASSSNTSPESASSPRSTLKDRKPSSLRRLSHSVSPVATRSGRNNAGYPERKRQRRTVRRGIGHSHRRQSSPPRLRNSPVTYGFESGESFYTASNPPQRDPPHAPSARPDSDSASSSHVLESHRNFSIQSNQYTHANVPQRLSNELSPASSDKSTQIHPHPAVARPTRVARQSSTTVDADDDDLNNVHPNLATRQPSTENENSGDSTSTMSKYSITGASSLLETHEVIHLPKKGESATDEAGASALSINPQDRRRRSLQQAARGDFGASNMSINGSFEGLSGLGPQRRSLGSSTRRPPVAKPNETFIGGQDLVLAGSQDVKSHELINQSLGSRIPTARLGPKLHELRRASETKEDGVLDSIQRERRNEGDGGDVETGSRESLVKVMNQKSKDLKQRVQERRNRHSRGHRATKSMPIGTRSIVERKLNKFDTVIKVCEIFSCICETRKYSMEGEDLKSLYDHSETYLPEIVRSKLEYLVKLDHRLTTKRLERWLLEAQVPVESLGNLLEHLRREY